MSSNLHINHDSITFDLLNGTNVSILEAQLCALSNHSFVVDFAVEVDSLLAAVKLSFAVDRSLEGTCEFLLYGFIWREILSLFEKLLCHCPVHQPDKSSN